MFGANQTLVYLLEHSSGCDSVQCDRENDCKEMKQLIHHTLLCKQMTCKVCFEVNTLVQCHSNRCTLHLCPVMTCSTLRQYSQCKGQSNGALSSYSNDIVALESLKHKCKASGGMRTKVRGTYQCGRCGMPKIRPHKCGEHVPKEAEGGLDSDSEDNEQSSQAPGARKPVEARVIASARAEVLRSQSLDERSTSYVAIQRSASIDLPVRSRAPTIALVKKSSFFCTGRNTTAEDGQDSICSGSGRSTRKRSASPDESCSGISRKRFDTAALCAGVATFDPRKQLSRCPSFASELSEESYSSSDTSQPSTETVATYDESQLFTCSLAQTDHHMRPTHVTQPAYPPPPPPGFWMPHPGTDFTQPLQPPSQSYSMIQIQDPFGRPMMVPYWGPPPGFTAPLLRTQSLGGEGLGGSDRRPRAHTPLRASSLRRRLAHSRGCSPEDPPTATSHGNDEALCSKACDSNGGNTGPSHRTSQFFHQDSADTTTDPSLDSLEVQQHLASTSTSAALRTVEVDAELELDLDAFALDLSVSFTPGTSAAGSARAPRTATADRRDKCASGRYSDAELFQYLNEELVTAC